MPRVELVLTAPTLRSASGAMLCHLREGCPSRVTLANGDQVTLEELLGGPVELLICNETITTERINARKNPRPGQ